MGAKTWMLVGCDGSPKDIFTNSPVLDREGARELARRMFPRGAFTEVMDGDLSSTNPPDDEIYVGVFPGLSVIAAGEFGIDFPSRLPKEYLAALPYRNVFLHAMHSVVDWFAFSVWEDGKLRRALSLSPDSGILEDIGEKYSFEVPFWRGDHRDEEDDEDLDEEEKYPFVFHPLDLGEAVLGNLFGYVLEGYQDLSVFDPEEVPLMTLKRSPKTPN